MFSRLHAELLTFFELNNNYNNLDLPNDILNTTSRAKIFPKKPFTTTKTRRDVSPFTRHELLEICQELLN
jgi:hypothetical protein